MQPRLKTRLRYTSAANVREAATNTGNAPLPVVKSAAGEKQTAAANSSNLSWKNALICLLVLLLVGVTIALIVLLVNDESDGSSTPSMAMLSMTPSSALVSPRACPMADGRLEDELERMRQRIRANAQRRGSVDWSAYVAAPEQHAGKRVLMRQEHFRNGTLRLVTSGVFVLDEPVVFEPQAWNDWRPARRNQTQYSTAPFVLDFFAALTVEAKDIVIDLNGHELRQSDVHAVQQRFFAVIQLGSSPFLAGQGPANFGPDPFTVDGLVVENGVLGRSSHHGMHGNGGRHVLLRNLRIRNYEVASIALNGFKRVVIDRVNAEGTSHDVAVLGTYSNVRFALPFAYRVLDNGDTIGVSYTKQQRLRQAVDAVEVLAQQVVDDIRATNSIDDDAHPEAAALFKNRQRVCDGNSYGIVVHPIGMAAGPYWSGEPPAAGTRESSEQIYIMRSHFDATVNHVVEVVALVADNDVTVRGPAGDVLRVTDNADGVACMDAETGDYVPNALADLQIALMDASLDVDDAATRKRYFGTTHGDQRVIDWAHGEHTMAHLVENEGFHYWRNGDTMFHVNKGTLGVRIEGSRSVCLEDVTVHRTENGGALGNVRALPGESSDVEAAYVGAQDGGHPNQAPQYGYMGADVRGLAVAASHTVHLSRVSVKAVKARAGLAYGIDVFNHAVDVHCNAGNAVDGVQTLTCDSDDVMAGQYANGPKVGQALGVHCSGGSAAASYGFASVQVSNVQSGVFEQAKFVAVGTVYERGSAERMHRNVYEI